MSNEMLTCPKCGENTLHKKRHDLGYRVCVQCSEVQRYGCLEVVNGKTGNTVQPIKDPKLAKELNRKGHRRNYGVATGMYK